MPDNKPILLIGPLPPGWGGARVSFKLFYDYLRDNCSHAFYHLDLPVRRNREGNPPGRVDHFKTSLHVVKAIARIPSAGSVVVFGSRNFCLGYGTLLLMISRIFRKPYYVRFFGGHPATDNILYKSSIIRKVVFKQLRHAERIIVETHVGASEFPQFLQKNMRVIVGYRPGFKAKPKRSKDNIVRYVYTGALTREKGVCDLLEAFAILCHETRDSHKCELHLYGTGPADLVEQATKTPHVIHHGRVDNTQLRRELASYDIFVFPSIYMNEGHPGSVIEAMMAGLPVIATDLSGTCEVVENDKSGILVGRSDVNALSEAMKNLLTDETKRKRLADGAIDASRQFDADLVLPKLAETLNIEITEE